MSAPIAFLVPSAAGGGVEKVAALLANEFYSRGITVDFLFGTAEGPNRGLLNPGIKQVDFGVNRMYKAIPGIRKYVRNRRPTAIFSRMPHTLLAAELALTGLRKKPLHIGSVHNIISAPKPSHSLIGEIRSSSADYAKKFLFNELSHLIAVSEGVRKQYIQHFQMPEQSVSTIYNPISIETIRNLAGQHSPHPWLTDERPLVVAAGRFTAQKRFDVLLHAFLRVNQETGARLIILGDGKLRPNLETLRAELNLDSVVDLPGYQLNPYTFMQQANLFVLSSDFEGLGNVLLEALAVGTPIVSTDCQSGPAEIIGDNEWGLLAPVGDPDALAIVMLRSLQSTHDTSALKRRAEQFDIKSVADKYLNLIQSLER